MKALVRRAADRLVDKAVPRVAADAEEGVCDYWSDFYCYCRNSYLYYRYITCDGGFDCWPRYGPAGCP